MNGITGTAGETVLDRRGLMAQVGGDTNLLMEVIDLFLGEASRLMLQSQEAVLERDDHDLFVAAHGLKGSVGNLCARQAWEAAGRLELLARLRRWDEVGGALGTLQYELNLLREALQEFRRQPGRPLRRDLRRPAPAGAGI